jgi:putative peptidoglycan lipid II flippase
MGGQRLGEAAAKGLLASAVMAAAVAGAAALLGGTPALIQVALAGGIGGLLYLGACAALRVEALGFFLSALRARFTGKGRVKGGSPLP